MNRKRLAALAMAGLMAAQVTTLAFEEGEYVYDEGQTVVVDHSVSVSNELGAVAAYNGSDVTVKGDVTLNNADYDTEEDWTSCAVAACEDGSKVTVNGNVTAIAQDGVFGVYAEDAEVTVNGNVSVGGEYYTVGVCAYDASVTVNGNVTAESDEYGVGIDAEAADVTVNGNVTAGDLAVATANGSQVVVTGDVVGSTGIYVKDYSYDSLDDEDPEEEESETVTPSYVEVGGSVIATDGVAIQIVDNAEVVVKGSVIADEGQAVSISSWASDTVAVIMGDVAANGESAAIDNRSGSLLIGGNVQGGVDSGDEHGTTAAVGIGGTVDSLNICCNSAVYANNVTDKVIIASDIEDVEQVVLGEWKEIEYSDDDYDIGFLDDETDPDDDAGEPMDPDSYEKIKGYVIYLLDLGTDKGNVNVETKVDSYITTILALNHDEDDDAQQAAIDKIVEQNGVLVDNEDGTVSGIYLNDEAGEDLTITVEAKAGTQLKGLAVIDKETGAVTPLTMEDGVYTITQEMVEKLIAGEWTLNVDCKLIPTGKGTYKVVKTEKTEQAAQALAINNEIEDGAFVIPEAVAGEAVELAIPKTGAASAEEVLEVTLKKVENLPKVGATSLGKNEEAEITAEDYTVNEDGTITLGAEFMANLEAADYVLCIKTVNGMNYFCFSVK